MGVVSFPLSQKHKENKRLSGTGQPECLEAKSTRLCKTLVKSLSHAWVGYLQDHPGGTRTEQPLAF